MCGIAGIATRESLSADWLHAMQARLSHRGPDDVGQMLWPDHGIGLAHRRLSIIDLSPAGRNPLSDESSSIWIVFNGEIYNYVSLRKELVAAGHIFRTHTDTEVVVHAYEEWGVASARRFRGMFAYGLYDLTIGQLFLVRDHVGIKPLVYHWDGKTFLFASEIKGLLAHPLARRDIDDSALFDFLTFLYIPTPKSAYRYIRKLPAGYYLQFDGHDISLACYWDVDTKLSIDCGVEDAVKLVHSRLDEATQLSTVADVPVGVFLSGGLDSSTIVASLAGTQNEPIRTFSIDFDVPGYSETRYARQVAERFATQHSERTALGQGLPELLTSVVGMYDEPFADGSAMPVLQVSRLARESVKVALGGDGGDEVFGGYRWYGRWLRRQKFKDMPQGLRQALGAVGGAWPETLPGLSLKRLLEELPLSDVAQYARQIELFGAAEKQEIVGAPWLGSFEGYDPYWSLRAFWKEELDPMTRMQYVDLKTYLPDDILTKVDRASMAVSLEVRPPLLDPPLIETVFSIPSNVRLRKGESKFLLKSAMTGELPPSILNRPKKGFSAPLGQWFAGEASWIESFLHDGAAVARGVIRPNATRHLGRYNRGPKLWALLILEQWLRCN